MSVFRERVEKHKEEIAELEEGEKLVEKVKPVSIVIKCITIPIYGWSPDNGQWLLGFN